ncbi:MAG TPA: hypothetical protein VF414_05870, partial [Thermoanaerobaculia bacterium]
MSVAEVATQEEGFESRLQGVVEGLARAIDDPKVIAAKAAEWVQENEPERLASAVWIDIDGNRDKGFEIRILKRSLRLGRVELNPNVLIGQNTAGVNVSVPIFTSASGV